MFDGLAGRFVQRGITTGFFQVQFLDIPVFHDDEFTDCRTGYSHSSGFFRVNQMLSDVSDDITVMVGYVILDRVFSRTIAIVVTVTAAFKAVLSGLKIKTKQ